MNGNKYLGDYGEKIVEQWLVENGFFVLAKNFGCRYGEIDIIASKKELVVFVEVKTRTNEYFPTSSVVNKSKQRKIIKTAQQYALKNRLFERVLRFDVATVSFDNGKPYVNYIENAFTL